MPLRWHGVEKGGSGADGLKIFERGPPRGNLRLNLFCAESRLVELPSSRAIQRYRSGALATSGCGVRAIAGSMKVVVGGLLVFLILPTMREEMSEVNIHKMWWLPP